MGKRKSNDNVQFFKEQDKSYIYLKDGKKDIGMLCWHYQKKKWVFEDWQNGKR